MRTGLRPQRSAAVAASRAPRKHPACRMLTMFALRFALSMSLACSSVSLYNLRSQFPNGRVEGLGTDLLHKFGHSEDTADNARVNSEDQAAETCLGLVLANCFSRAQPRPFHDRRNLRNRRGHRLSNRRSREGPPSSPHSSRLSAKRRPWWLAELSVIKNLEQCRKRRGKGVASCPLLCKGGRNMVTNSQGRTESTIQTRKLIFIYTSGSMLGIRRYGDPPHVV